MMARTTRRGLLAVALLVVLSYWLGRGTGGEGTPPIEGLDTRLSYALENFEMRAFDEAGQPAMRLWAPRLTNEAATNIGRVENPRVEVRHEGHLWNIMADTATISDDQEEVFLGGTVQLRREGTGADQRIEIDGREVVLVVEDRLARSTEAVRLRDGAGTLQARGFQVDLRNDEFQLHDDVQGVYVTPP